MANTNVHTGFWINHSRGSVLGATVLSFFRFSGIHNWSPQRHLRPSDWIRGPGRLSHSPSTSSELLSACGTMRNGSGAEDSAAWNICNLGRLWQGRRQNVWRSAGTLALLPALGVHGRPGRRDFGWPDRNEQLSMIIRMSCFSLVRVGSLRQRAPRQV